MKVWEIFWNTKNQLSFKSSSAAALIKKLSDGRCIEFCGTSGPSFWIRANFRWFGQPGVEKKSHKTASFKVTNFLPCPLFATGMSNMYTVWPEEQFKVQTSLRKRKNYNHNWTNTWKFFEFWEKTHGIWAKTFWKHCQNWNLHVQVFFLRKVYSWGKNLISKFSWILTKKHKSTLSEDFFGKSLFLSQLMAKSRPSSELRLVKKLPFDSKVWRKRNFVYLIAEKLWKKFINATKSKKQMNISFPVIVHINWKSIENAGEKLKKNESQRNLLKHQNSSQFSTFLRGSSDQKTVRRQIYKIFWDFRSFILNPCKL